MTAYMSFRIHLLLAAASCLIKQHIVQGGLSPDTHGPVKLQVPALHFQPNIVFILTDDQDKTQDSMDAMPATQNLFGLNGGKCSGGGRCFNMVQAHVTTPICCPSRASYLTGKYIHNHGTIQNSVSKGCAGHRWITEMETQSYAAILGTGAGVGDSANKLQNYTAAFFGKYLNAYGTGPSPLTHIPLGWSHWVALSGNSRYYNYDLSINGKTERHSSNYATDYLTDLLANRSVAWLAANLANQKKEATRKPLLLAIHTPAPHRPAQPAPQFINSFTEKTAPRTAAWNYVGKDKHLFLSELQPMNASMIEYSDHVWRRRLRSLQSVDELVARQFATVADAGEMDRTIFIYTSDHGYHSGQWAVPVGKMLPYNEDVQIPMFIRLPPSSSLGVQQDLHSSEAFGAVPILTPVLNIDIAPTILDFAGYETPAHMDGESIVQYLMGFKKDASQISNDQNNRTFLIEYFPIPAEGRSVHVVTKGDDGWCTDPDVVKQSCPNLTATVDSVNNTWACARSVNLPHENSLYCYFWDGTNLKESFIEDRLRIPPNFVEYYDLLDDPNEMHNGVSKLNTTYNVTLRNRLMSLLWSRRLQNSVKSINL